jgi:hypothetical protein
MGLPLFVRGLPEDVECTEIPMPCKYWTARMDLLAQLRQGKYITPTCIVHPTKDKLLLPVEMVHMNRYV